MGFFDEVDSIVINNKEVQSIISSDGGIIYEKSSGYELTLTADKSIVQTGESATLSATLTNNNVPMSGETIFFYDSNNPPITRSSAQTHTLNVELGSSFKLIYQSSSTYGESIRLSNEDDSLLIQYSGYNNNVYISINGGVPVTAFSCEGFLKLENGVLSDDGGHSYNLSSYNLNFKLKEMDTVGNNCSVYINPIGSAVTDANGVASVSYVGKGVGDIDVQADYNGIIQSEIFVIEDCYSYDLTNYTSTMLTSLQIPNTPFELTYKSILKSNTAHNTNLNIYGVLSDGTSEIISVIGIGNKDHAGWHLSFVSGGQWEVNYAPNSKPLNTEYVVKYTYDDGLHSLYVDNQLLVSTTKIMNNMHDIWVGIGQSEYIKDLKVKPL